MLCKSELISIANQFGFSRVQFATAASNVALNEYDRFLANGFHGTMNWMVTSRPPRANIRQLLPSLQTVMVLGVDYWHPRPERPPGLMGKVSCYAWGRDYHKVINKQLKKMGQHLQTVDPGLEGYWTVDSRPVIERGWAAASGLGFVGKNTMIISPAQSSYFFLATMLINRIVEPDEPIIHNHCGRCTRCLDRCPTNAFVEPFRLDARKCISYLTIEHANEIDAQYVTPMQDWLFGCDECQDVCPHNHRKWLESHPDFAPRPNHSWVDLEWLCKSDPKDVLDEFAGTPLRRTGVDKLRRNAVVLLWNQRDNPDALVLLEWLEHNESSPLVQRQLQICRSLSTGD